MPQRFSFATSGQFLGNFWATSGQLLGTFCALSANPSMPYSAASFLYASEALQIAEKPPLTTFGSGRVAFCSSQIVLILKYPRPQDSINPHLKKISAIFGFLGAE